MMSGTWLSPAARGRLVVGAFGLAAGLGAWTHARVLVPRTAALLSLRRPLERHAQWVQSGALPRALAIHRLRDPGFDVYGPDPADVQVLASRRDIIGHLNTTAPRVALIRDIDFPTVHQSHHEHGWPLFVLDTSSFHMMLVSNVLVPGAEDLNRIPEVLHREPPTLAHETLVRFEQYVEIIGWQIDAPIVRGGKHTLQIAIRVLRPLPGGSKIYARFLQGRLSRINAEPHELAEGLYPCSLWRAGDYILHRFEFEAPTLEILPGDHEFVVGLRRSEKNNYEITVPEGKTGEHGVVIRDKKRNFATLGEVPVW
jgi:hypothetical protein